jgi:hypothetical protein
MKGNNEFLLHLENHAGSRRTLWETLFNAVAGNDFPVF